MTSTALRTLFDFSIESQLMPFRSMILILTAGLTSSIHADGISEKAQAEISTWVASLEQGHASTTTTNETVVSDWTMGLPRFGPESGSLVSFESALWHDCLAT